jgi:hypothetical protein
MIGIDTSPPRHAYDAEAIGESGVHAPFLPIELTTSDRECAESDERPRTHECDQNEGRENNVPRCDLTR